MLHLTLAIAVLSTAAPFDPAIPTPESELGYEPGDRIAPPADIVAYFEALAGATSRARLEVMGQTHEGRPLIVLAISSEENLARAEQVAATFREVSDPRRVASDRAAAARLEGLPAVAWMGYSIHGNEVSGADASMVVAYRLAAGMDDEVKAWRKNMIVYIDPLQNPDGRQRTVGTFDSMRSAVTDYDLNSLSHAEMWPGGRGNHYLFDLNRDWFALVHPESRARVPRIARVLPQLQVDAHEMGPNSTFLFTPSRAPFNPHRPATLHGWERRFSQDQARAFDANGWSYYTREWNEEFFPGYGSSWAAYLGTVGILYEQARTMGGVVRQAAGTVLTYKDAVARQVISSFANLDTLSRNRAGVLRDWLKARRSAARPGATDVKAYVIRADRYPARAATLVDALLMQSIDVLRAEKPIRIDGAFGIFGPVGRVTVPAGSYVVRLDQPAGRLIRNLFDFHLPMGAAFLREQREYLEQGKGSRLYDMTAWSLAHAYGLQTVWTRSIPRGAFKTLSAAPSAKGGVSGSAGYGFLIDGTSDRAVMLAGRMMARGLALRVAREPTTIEGRSFPRGSILIKNDGNPNALATIDPLAKALGVEVVGVSTNLASQGTDLGGGNLRSLVEPKVAMLAGEPIRSDAYGFVWHLLDQRIGIRVSRLNIARLARTDLRTYNVLIVPNTWNAGALRARLGPAAAKKLKEWVAGGGTLIALGNGAEAIADPKLKMTDSRFRRHVLERYPPVVFGLDPEVAERAGRMRAVGLRATPKRDPKKPTPSAGWSDPKRPYHVPPVIGPGARPFMTSSPPPFDWPTNRRTLDAWAALLAPAEKKAKKTFIEKADARLRRFLPSGVYLAADADDDHWLTYGVDPRLPLYFNARDALIAETPAEIPVRFTEAEQLHLGGLLWPEAAGRLARTAYLVRESRGRGQVILFASDPAFRGYAFATQRLLMNAIVWGPGMGTDWASPW